MTRKQKLKLGLLSIAAFFMINFLIWLGVCFIFIWDIVLSNYWSYPSIFSNIIELLIIVFGLVFSVVFSKFTSYYIEELKY